jgi:uncharacterized protein
MDNEGLLSLLKLQDVDSSIDLLRQNKQVYPKRIDELQKLINQLTGERQEVEKQAKEHRSSCAHFKQQLEATKDNLDKRQVQLQEITTNKQYEALQAEILTLKNATDEYEMELLTADEKAGALDAQLVETEGEFKEKTGTAQTEIDDLESRIAVIDKDIAKVDVRRAKVEKEVPARLTTLYKRVRRRNKLAVVRVSRGACGGCWKSLPLQRINELRMHTRLITCENCGRILAWDHTHDNDE